MEFFKKLIVIFVMIVQSASIVSKKNYYPCSISVPFLYELVSTSLFDGTSILVMFYIKPYESIVFQLEGQAGQGAQCTHVEVIKRHLRLLKYQIRHGAFPKDTDSKNINFDNINFDMLSSGFGTVEMVAMMSSDVLKELDLGEYISSSSLGNKLADTQIEKLKKFLEEEEKKGLSAKYDVKAMKRVNIAKNMVQNYPQHRDAICRLMFKAAQFIRQHKGSCSFEGTCKKISGEDLDKMGYALQDVGFKEAVGFKPGKVFTRLEHKI